MARKVSSKRGNFREPPRREVAGRGPPHSQQVHTRVGSPRPAAASGFPPSAGRGTLARGGLYFHGYVTVYPRNNSNRSTPPSASKALNLTSDLFVCRDSHVGVRRSPERRPRRRDTRTGTTSPGASANRAVGAGFKLARAQREARPIVLTPRKTPPEAGGRGRGYGGRRDRMKPWRGPSVPMI